MLFDLAEILKMLFNLAYVIKQQEREKIALLYITLFLRPIDTTRKYEKNKDETFCIVTTKTLA